MRARSRALPLFAGLVAVSSIAATSYVAGVASVPVRSYGPVITLQASLDSALGTTGRFGGLATGFVAKSTDTLKVGDVVFLDTLGVVSKSATIANYNKVVGVVIGGRSDTMNVRNDSASVGTTAALPSQKVVVLRWGLAWMKIDTVTAGLTAGTGVIPSATTAGLIRARTTAIDTFGRIIGKSINGGAASAKVQVLLNVR